MAVRSTVQVSPETHARLRQMAQAEHESTGDAVARLVALYDEARFWEEFEAGVAAIRADPEAWAEELAEREIWDTALNDGLEDE